MTTTPTMITGQDKIIEALKQRITAKFGEKLDAGKIPGVSEADKAKRNLGAVLNGPTIATDGQAVNIPEALKKQIKHASIGEAELDAIATEMTNKLAGGMNGAAFTSAGVNDALGHSGQAFWTVAKDSVMSAVESKLTGSGNVKVEDVKAAFDAQRAEIEAALKGKGIDLGALKAGEVKGLKCDEVVEKIAKSFSTQHAKDAGKVIEGIETTAVEISKGMHVSGDAAKAAFNGFLANVKDNAQTLTPDELNTVFRKTGDKGVALGKLEEGANKLAAQLKAAGTDAGKRTKALEGFDKDMSKLAEESAKVLSKEGGWVAKQFIKPSFKGIGEEFSAAWKGDKVRFGMKAGGTTLGVALMGHGGMRAATTDQETGESHPVGGLIEAGAGAALLAASLLARGKVGGASVGV